MRFHPYSEIFPLLDGAALRELADDITQHGLREPIWTFGGLILDGRNRFLACQKANIKPAFRAYVGSEAQALAWVVSANIHRRHLNDTQRATAAAKISNLRSGQRSDEMKSAVPIGTAAQMLNVSERQVKRARKVEEKGSKPLKKAVEKGEISISRAAAVADLPKSEQLAAAQSPQPREPDELDEPERPDESEDAVALESAEREWRARMDKILTADDKLAAIAKELKQAQDELTAAKQARDRYMNENAALLRQNKALQRKLDRLEKKAA